MISDAEAHCTGPPVGPTVPREVRVLVGANAVVALGYGVVAPVLPQYARHFGVGVGAATFVITAFAIMRLVGAAPAGLLVQRLGERRVYIAGLLVVAMSTAACAFAQTYGQLLLFRSLGGLGSAMFTVSSFGLMIRISPRDARGRVAGWFTSAFLVGSVGGPALGSLTAGLGLAMPFVVYGVALLVAAAVIRVSLRHSTLGAPEARSEPTVSVSSALRNRAYRAALSSNFATGWAAFGLRVSLVPLVVIEVLGRGPGWAGLVLATFAIGNVAVVIPSGYLSDRVGRRLPLLIGLPVAAVATALIGVTTALPALLAVAFVGGAATGVFVAPQQAAVADVIGGNARSGTAVATFQMTSDLGAIIGSLAVGQIVERVSYGVAFAVSGAVLVLAAVLWAFAPETRPDSATEPTTARPLGPTAGGEMP